MAPRWSATHGLWAVVVAAVSLLGAEASPQPSRPRPDMAAATRAAAQLPRLHSLVVSWRGDAILEHYATGMSASRLANVKSVSKSVISALIGIAIDRGLIKSVKEPISTFFPELRRDPDLRKQAITVEDLLTMRSGLRSTSGSHYGEWVRSRNWVGHALSRPIVSDPGTTMEYSTGSTHVLSAILTKVSGTSTWQFAQTALAQPLGIRLARWQQDPKGIYFGGNEMLMTPRQMVAIGGLYLNGGRVNGRQVVPSTWVNVSCVPRTVSRWDPDREYGYGWWIDELGGRQACFAWGFGGQYIFVFRDLELVIAATSSTTLSDERRGYRRTLLTLIEQHVIPPIDDAQSH